MPGFICLLFTLTVFFPMGVLLSDCFGYTFQLISVSAFAITIGGLSVLLVVFDMFFKAPIENKAACFLLAIISPLSLLNAVFYISRCSGIWVISSVLISVGCCCYLATKHGKPFVIRTVTLILSALMILPICYLGFFVFLFRNIAQNTVSQTVESPSGKYYAQVIINDQGALGGNTLVNVHETCKFDAIAFRIEKKPQRMYCGDWSEFNNMQIYWKDDECLVINSVEYDIE